MAEYEWRLEVAQPDSDVTQHSSCWEKSMQHVCVGYGILFPSVSVSEEWWLWDLFNIQKEGGFIYLCPMRVQYIRWERKISLSSLPEVVEFCNFKNWKCFSTWARTAVRQLVSLKEIHLTQSDKWQCGEVLNLNNLFTNYGRIKFLLLKTWNVLSAVCRFK